MSTKTSINKHELEKFRKISNQWWKEEGGFRLLHKINPIRVSYILNMINHHFNIYSNKSLHNQRQINNDEYYDIKLDILEVGCGGGLVTSSLSKQMKKAKNINIIGIDAVQDNIDIAAKYAKEQDLPIKYLPYTVEELIASEIKYYNVILCLEVIEHVDNVEDFIKNLSSLLKPNGMMIISTINRTPKAYILSILMAEYILGWVKKKTHDFSKFLKPSEIYSMFKKNNIELQELKGLTYNIIDNNWQLSEDIGVNYFAYLKHIC